jgi:hypothetical protein
VEHLSLDFSAVRTLAVTTAANHEPEAPLQARVRRSLAGLYGATAAFVVSILAVAVALAHF